MRLVVILFATYILVNVYVGATGSSNSDYCRKHQTNLEFYLLPGRGYACTQGATTGASNLSKWLNAPHQD
jgi:hypothetical protein